MKSLMTGTEVGGPSVLAKGELIGSVSLIQAVEGKLKRADIPWLVKLSTFQDSDSENQRRVRC